MTVLGTVYLGSRKKYMTPLTTTNRGVNFFLNGNGNRFFCFQILVLRFRTCSFMLCKKWRCDVVSLDTNVCNLVRSTYAKYGNIRYIPISPCGGLG